MTPAAFSISQACLVDTARLCAAVNSKPASLNASYSFEHVPLELANTLAPDVLPGELQGEVRVMAGRRRDGQWFGDCVTSSPPACVMAQARRGAAPGGAREPAHASALRGSGHPGRPRRHAGQREAEREAGPWRPHGRVDDGLGSQRGRAALAGKIHAAMPTLAPFGAFVPAVANLDGRWMRRSRSAARSRPEFTGNVDATRLQADLGELGIELREGRGARRGARAAASRSTATSLRQGTAGIPRLDDRARRRRPEIVRREFPGGRHAGGQRRHHAGPGAHRRSRAIY